MIRKLLFTCMLALFTIGMTWAQDKQVTGQVTDAETGEGIPGATVQIKGTTEGVGTDFDGKFTIKISSNQTVLIISSIGYTNKEVEVGNQTTLNVSMSADSKELDAVVVVAYGEQKKSSLTGAVSEVGAEQISRLQVSSVAKALEGTTPGVQVAGSTGQPGSSLAVRVRGFSSINSNMSPLYVVDGMPFNGNLNTINPDDIQSMSVLKDATATVLYGSRASNGVVLITTKKGKKGGIQLNLKARYGVMERAMDDYDRLGSAQYYEMMFESYKNTLLTSGLSMEDAIKKAAEGLIDDKLGSYNSYNVPSDKVIGLDGKINPNAKLLYEDSWDDEMFGTATRKDYTLSVTGATEKSDFLFSIGYLDEEGVMQNTSFERYSARLKVNTDVKDWLKVGTNLAYSRTSGDQLASGTATSNPYYYAQRIGSIFPVYRREADGSYMLDGDGSRVYDFGANPGQTRPYAPNSNPAATVELDDRIYSSNNISARAFAEFEFIKDLKFRANVGGDFTDFNRLSHQNRNLGDASSDQGRTTKTGTYRFSITSNQLLSYKRTIGASHNIDVMIGHESYYYESEFFSASKTGFPLPGINVLSTAASVESTSGDIDFHSIESYLSRVLYDYDEKYFLSFSLRRDGTSRFYKDNRWGNFWSVGASWRVTEEEFLSSADWLNNLKVRASYGTIGNEGVTTGGVSNFYPWQSLYSLEYPNVGYNGAIASALENQDLIWETGKSFNAGLDFRVFDRVSGTVDFYNKLNDDLLYNTPLPYSTGYVSIVQNIGEIQNRGLEIGLSADIIRNSDFNWNMNISWATNKNEITELAEEGNVNGSKRWEEGKSIYEYYIYEFAGVDPANGDALYYTDRLDDEENPLITTNAPISSDKRYVGETAMPDFFGGLTNSFSYKGFDMSVFIAYSVGGKILDYNHRGLMIPNYGNALHVDVLNSWKEPGQVTDVPRFEQGVGELNRTSTRHLVDASYWSLRNITFGYSLPKNWLEKIDVSNVRAFVTADNLYINSATQGLNPSQNFSGVTDNGGYSPVRTISFGLDINL